MNLTSALTEEKNDHQYDHPQCHVIWSVPQLCQAWCDLQHRDIKEVVLYTGRIKSMSQSGTLGQKLENTKTGTTKARGRIIRTPPDPSDGPGLYNFFLDSTRFKTVQTRRHFFFQKSHTIFFGFKHIPAWIWDTIFFRFKPKIWPQNKIFFSKNPIKFYLKSYSVILIFWCLSLFWSVDDILRF